MALEKFKILLQTSEINWWSTLLELESVNKNLARVVVNIDIESKTPQSVPL